MEKIFTGWIGKSAKYTLDFSGWDMGEGRLLAGVFEHKGKKKEWEPEDWPPVKVKVTVEVLED